MVRMYCCHIVRVLSHPLCILYRHPVSYIAILQVGMRFLTERGQNVNGQPNIIYVSTDNGATWLPLHEFVDVCILWPQCRIASISPISFNQQRVYTVHNNNVWIYSNNTNYSYTRVHITYIQYTSSIIFNMPINKKGKPKERK